MSRIRLTLLGTFRLEIDGRTRCVPTRKCEALITYLALREQPHRRDSLALLLWGDVSLSQARHSLRQALSGLRHILQDVPGPVLVTEGETVQIERSLIEVDAVQFRALAASDKAEDLCIAAGLYGGQLLEGMQLNESRFDSWLDAERAMLHHFATVALETQLQQALASGRSDRAISLAVSLLGIDPTQEHVHRLLMTLYRRQGHSWAALQQYNACARTLRQELGVEPDLATRTLCQEIILERSRGTPGLLPAAGGASGASRPTPVGKVLVLGSHPAAGAMLERVLTHAGHATVLLGEVADIGKMDLHSCAAVVCDAATRRTLVDLLARLHTAEYAGAVLLITANAPRAIGESGGLRVRYLRRPVHPRVLLASLREALSQKPRTTGL